MLRFDMPAKECPLCGGTMRLKRTETAVQIPGNPRATVHQLAEWICPDCNYFEEADEEKT
jgi:C4-type Zn-finger protein